MPLTHPLTYLSESYLSAYWDGTNIPPQASITPFVEALSTASSSMDRVFQAAWASVGNSAVSQYHMTGFGVYVTASETSNPAAMITLAFVGLRGGAGGDCRGGDNGRLRRGRGEFGMKEVLDPGFESSYTPWSTIEREVIALKYNFRYT
jgi:hypothetical protein